MTTLDIKQLEADLSEECDRPGPFLNPRLYRLLGEWVALSDERFQKPDTEGVKASLLRAGFASDDMLGLGKQAYDDCAETMGRYCAGQALSMLNSINIVHPMLAEWLISLSERPVFQALAERESISEAAAAGSVEPSRHKPAL